MNKENPFLFSKSNYILIGLGVLLIIVGFVLMIGSNPDPAVFDTEKVYGFQRITLAPILILLGFALEFFAIFKK